MQSAPEIFEWLLEGDPAIRWQVQRDLLQTPQSTIQAERARVSTEGWGARLLALQDPDGKWGGGLYTHKWTSTTYTLLLLRRLGLAPDNPQAAQGCLILMDKGIYTDGGINFSKYMSHSETCISGMVLSILAYFQTPDERVHTLTDYCLNQQMPDGGWNCQSYEGATHSSFHTTTLVLEGLRLYETWQPKHIDLVHLAQERGREFLLQHRLFRSHRTGQIVHPAFTRFSFPPRWHYDVLRGLDYFQDCQAAYDTRLVDAITLVVSRRQKDGRWKLQNQHAGRTFFEMEAVGLPSRWNTLRALRVLRWWDALQTDRTLLP
jgi:hypothetical protein